MDDRVFFLLMAPIMVGVCWLIRYAMLREDFEGMRTAAEYKRDLPTRELLDGHTFYQRFYANSGIREELVWRFICFQAEFWEVNPELIRPQDNYSLAIGNGCSDAEFIAAMESKFEIEITDEECLQLNGTFDSLLRFIDAKASDRAIDVPD